MRTLKLCTILGVLAALVVPAAPSWAVALPPAPASPFKIIVGAYDMGTLYPTLTPGGPAVTGSGNLDPIGLAAPGAYSTNEDSWGIGTVNQIQTAHIVSMPPPGSINGGVGTIYWLEGDADTELVLAFWGARDNYAAVDILGTLTTFSTDLQFALWAQPNGTSDEQTSLLLSGGASNTGSTFSDAGSGGRIITANGFVQNSGAYVGAGYDYLGNSLASATVMLTGTGTANFFGGAASPVGTSNLETQFAPAGFTGQATSYISVGSVTLPDGTPLVGVQNADYDTSWFESPYVNDVTADLLLTLTTQAITSPPVVTNDFLVSANGPVAGYAVPEPLTMLGLMLGVGGLAGYIRKRRTA